MRQGWFTRVASAVAGGVALACGTPDNGRVVSAESGAIDVAVARPAFTLLDTDGNPFDFAARTAGKLTFLEFGYTNCPDVCPVHMANLAAVLRNVRPTDRLKSVVVFVSIDPDRDSAHVLRRWLNAFDAEFVGLTGSREALNAAQAAVGFGPATVQPASATTPESVTHAAPVLVFTADDTAHVMYPFGTRQADWARDIPRLLAKRGAGGSVALRTRRSVDASATTNPDAVAGAAGRSASPPPREISVERAYIVLPAGNAAAALYLVARNSAASPDSLRAISVESLGPAMLHESVLDKVAGTASMRSVVAAGVPAGGVLRLAPGGLHGMVAMQRKPVRGDRIAVTLTFARAGMITGDATVITYADVDTATAVTRRR